MAEFRMAEGEKVVVVKIIINFSWIGKCIEYYKKLHFSTHSRRINPISLKRSTPTKHDILAAILSRGSRLQRDRVAAERNTRALKIFQRNRRQSFLAVGCRPPPTFPPVRREKFVCWTGIREREKDGRRSFGNSSIVIAARYEEKLRLSFSLRSLNDEK